MSGFEVIEEGGGRSGPLPPPVAGSEKKIGLNRVII